ncbi:MAG: hypothetical protein R3B47_14365 [Bacteroidia bacterium]
MGQEKEKSRFDELVDKGRSFLADRVLDSAEHYLVAASPIKLKSARVPAMKAIANRQLADFSQKSEKLDLAFEYALISVREARTCKDSAELAQSLMQAGGVCFRKNTYETALDYFLEASSVAQKLEKVRSIFPHFLFRADLPQSCWYDEAIRDL